jgi:F0F1-type ATP synthase membrane subunit b/b'
MISNGLPDELIVQIAECPLELIEKIKKEIVDVSSMLAEKILDREIKEEDHHDFIESFIENIGESE